MNASKENGHAAKEALNYLLDFLPNFPAVGSEVKDRVRLLQEFIAAAIHKLPREETLEKAKLKRRKEDK